MTRCHIGIKEKHACTFVKSPQIVPPFPTPLGLQLKDIFAGICIAGGLFLCLVEASTWMLDIFLLLVLDMLPGSPVIGHGLPETHQIPAGSGIE